MKPVSLDKLLQSQGFGTRKYCRQLIETGEVQLNGQVVTNIRHACLATIGLDGAATDLTLRIFDEDWMYRPQIYLALNKPSEYECSRKPSHHPSVMTLLPEQFSWRDVQAVGRLDHDTTGLLLLSDDGSFIHAQTSPKRHVPKVYVATTQTPVTTELITAFLAGVQLHDEPIPIAAVDCRALGEFTVQIVLEQGKYHQVKRMLAAVGNHCEQLTRIQIGGLKLSEMDLPQGSWCYLTAEQLEQLQVAYQ